MPLAWTIKQHRRIDLGAPLKYIESMVMLLRKISCDNRQLSLRGHKDTTNLDEFGSLGNQKAGSLTILVV